MTLGDQIQGSPQGLEDFSINLTNALDEVGREQHKALLDVSTDVEFSNCCNKLLKIWKAEIFPCSNPVSGIQNPSAGHIV